MTTSIAGRSRYPVVPYQYYAGTGSGHTPSRSVEEYWQDCTIPWVTTADVKHLRDGQRQVVEDTEFHVNDLGLANSAARLRPAGTVVLSRTASVGFSAIMGAPMATSQDFVTWSPGPELEPRYLLWVLRAMKGIGDFDRLMYGSTHKTIYVPDLQQLRGPLPPLEVQRRVADHLDTETTRVDALIELNERRTDLLKERLAAEREHLVVGLSVPIGYYLRRLVQGTSPIADNAPAAAGSAGVLKLSAIRQGVFLSTENKALDGYAEAEGPFVERGSVLISRANTRDRVGDVAFVEDVGPSRPVLPDLMYELRFDSRVDARYVTMALLAREARDQMQAVARGSSQTMVKLRQSDVRELRLRLPALSDQQQAARTYENTVLRTQAALRPFERQNQLLQERREALITAAVTGQIEV